MLKSRWKLVFTLLLVVVEGSLLPAQAQSGPGITSLSPNSGVIGSSVKSSGASFGSLQGSSTVAFNGIAATAINWSSSAISVVVPNGATTGNIVVTVSGVP